jgi:hypothetical protein
MQIYERKNPYWEAFSRENVLKYVVEKDNQILIYVKFLN